MKLFKYLAYKIFTLLAAGFLVEKDKNPLIRRRGVIDRAQKRILFDFSHRTTHLGDRLFFLPLMAALQAEGCELLLASNDKLTQSLFNGLLQSPLPMAVAEEDFNGLVVIQLPSLLDRYKKYPFLLAADFTDPRCDKGIAQQLVESIAQELDMQLRQDLPLLLKAPVFSSVLPQEEGVSYFVFSNYIDSGGFRKFFVNEEVLPRKVRELRALGHRIVHVGSERDKAGDVRHYDFVDIDLRGQMRIEDMPGLLNDPRVQGIVSYDNVFMHLAGLFGKQAFVLFRGRLSKTAYRHHMAHVNNTFFKNVRLLQYLA